MISSLKFVKLVSQEVGHSKSLEKLHFLNMLQSSSNYHPTKKAQATNVEQEKIVAHDIGRNPFFPLLFYIFLQQHV